MVLALKTRRRTDGETGGYRTEALQFRPRINPRTRAGPRLQSYRCQFLQQVLARMLDRSGGTTSDPASDKVLVRPALSPLRAIRGPLPEILQAHSKIQVSPAIRPTVRP